MFSFEMSECKIQTGSTTVAFPLSIKRNLILYNDYIIGIIIKIRYELYYVKSSRESHAHINNDVSLIIVRPQMLTFK